jgi:hypothetical protein
MPPKQQQTGSIQQQIADAITSGSLERRSRDQQGARDKQAHHASASAAKHNASLDDDNTASAILSGFPQRLAEAIANGHGFVPLFEIKGKFDAQDISPRATKIIEKLTELGLKVAVRDMVGDVSHSLQLGVKV